MSDGAADALDRRAFLRGAAGAAAVGATTGVASAQDEGGDGNDTEGEDGDGEAEEVVVELVDFAFDPGTDEPLHVEPGTMVRFVWSTSNHNIAVLEAPDESDWEGEPDIQQAGYEHTHTFEVQGDYEFVCEPHMNQDMYGDIVVTDDPPEQTEAPPQIPEEAMTLGIATAFALSATLGFAYVFIKYGGEPPVE